MHWIGYLETRIGILTKCAFGVFTKCLLCLFHGKKVKNMMEACSESLMFDHICAARSPRGCGIQTHEMNDGFHVHPHQWSLHLRLLKSKPRTTIIIAHRPSRNAVFADSIDSPANLSIMMTLCRLSTVRDANQICVFNHGRIVEKGRHATWLKMF